MPEPGRAPTSERVCEAVCTGFALWTLCAHAVVAAGGSLRWLIALYVATGAAALTARGWLRQSRPPPASREASEGEATRVPAGVRKGLFAAAVACAAAALLLDDPITTWLLLLVVLGAAAVVFLGLETQRPEPAHRSPSAERGLLAIAVGCALYTLVVHRPDADDAFYVNLAIAAVDLPELPLLARDTLHGRFDLPIHFPSYRLHSYELWNATIVLLSGIPALYVFHWISASAAALLVPLCHATLFRRLTPRCWPWTTLALVIVLAAAGETHRWYGNFAFVRIWQGKSIYLFVFMPLVYAFAIRFAQRGDRASWLHLAAAQIAALGCSAAALWGAPLGALLAMLCVLRPTREGLRRLGTGALASAYLIGAGLLLKSEMSASLPELTQLYEPGVRLAGALHTVLGDQRLYAVGIASLFLAFVCCPPGLARRFAIALPLATVALLLNPWADASVRAHVTGPWFWRALWAVPLPTLLALIAVAPLSRPGALERRAPHLAACLALLAAFAVWVPRFPGFSASNEGAWIGWPALKVAPAHRWARALNELAPRQRVVAPAGVSAWIPVPHDHAYPMMVRIYLDPLRERIGEIAYRDRVLMTRFAGGNLEHPRAAAIFERGLDLYDVQAVGIANSEHLGTAREILRRTGFLKRIQGTDLEVWSRAVPHGPT
jgi:hypothetical protein